MPLSEVLVPVDFSQRCVCAGRYAAALKQRFSCHVTLLHVLPMPYYEFAAVEAGGGMVQELLDARTEEAREALCRFMRDELPSPETQRLVREGDPATKIVKAAQNLGASLIVMPTHGHGPFRRFILGSVTAKVLHDADCPVLTGVHMDTVTREEVRFRHVIAALDLGPQSERTLQWAAAFSERVHAHLTVVHATPSLEGRTAEYFDPNWRNALAVEARERIEKLEKDLGLDAPIVAESGEAANVVCDMARTSAADLLVIGRSSSAGVLGRLRAIAYTIVRQSPCPVVSV